MTKKKFKSVLVICRSLTDLKYLNKIKSKKNNRLIFATDSIELYEKVLGNRLFYNVILIDQMFSVYDVLDDVLILRKKINEWLTSINPGTPKFLIEFEKHAEGGVGTQNIQDTLLIIKSYLKIIKKFHISDFIIIRSLNFKFEDNLLIQIAKSYNINVAYISSFKNNLFSRFNFVKRTIKLFDWYPVLIIPSSTYYLLLKLKLLFRVLSTKITNAPKIDSINENNEKVVFLFEGNAEKSVIDNILMAKEFNKNNFLSILLSWGTSSNQKNIVSNDIVLVKLENWFPYKYFFRVIIDYIILKINIFSKLSKIESLESLSYKDIQLGKIITPIIIEFVKTILFKRFVMHLAAENFFSKNYPAIIRIRGEIRLDLDRICYESLKNVRPMGAKFPTIFTYQTMLELGIVYGSPVSDALDLYFVFSDYEKKLYNKILNKTKVIIGSTIFIANQKVQKSDMYQEFYDRLNLNIKKNIVVLYASASIVNGLFSVRESYFILKTIISYAKKNPKIFILIKPHPSENTSLINFVYTRMDKPPNVKILENNYSINHCINIADIVIQKISSVALIAMKYKKPVISFSLDGEKRFLDVLGFGTEKFQSSETLTRFFDDIFKNNNTFKNWVKKRIEKQNAFLKERIYKKNTKIEQFIVNTVISENSKSKK